MSLMRTLQRLLTSLGQSHILKGLTKAASLLVMATFLKNMNVRFLSIFPF